MLTLARRLPLWSRLLVALLAATLIAVGLLTASARAWADDLTTTGRILEGTSVAGVDVSGMTRGEAHGAVSVVLDERLAEPVTLRAEDRTWETNGADLGVIPDVEAALDAALQRVTDASLIDVLRWRWLGTIPPAALEVDVEAPDDEVGALVERIASELDVEQRGADLTWADERTLAVRPAVVGLRLDQEESAAAVREAIAAGVPQVDLTVERTEPDVDDDMVSAVLDDIQSAVDGALDREVELAFEERTWRVSPRDVGAAPELAPLLAAALERGDDPGGEPLPVELRIEDEAVSEAVADIAAELDVPGGDARVDYSDGWITRVEATTGLAVEREPAIEQLTRGLHSEDVGTIELVRVETEPDVTLARYRHVLLLRQDLRRVFLYRDGEIIRDWPVAVGAGGSPTPTGVFQVGAKRYLPTWTNPAPNGWGADMPASIGPGPGNPLGLRALNWNRNGRDTLIRFHGTPQASSIGQAASKGCVRMYNSDVVEMYDLVPAGTTIVSLTTGSPRPPSSSA